MWYQQSPHCLVSPNVKNGLRRKREVPRRCPIILILMHLRSMCLRISFIPVLLGWGGGRLNLRTLNLSYFIRWGSFVSFTTWMLLLESIYERQLGRFWFTWNCIWLILRLSGPEGLKSSMSGTDWDLEMVEAQCWKMAHIFEHDKVVRSEICWVITKRQHYAERWLLWEL